MDRSIDRNREVTVIRILGERPGNVPEGYIVMNAPRPLIGAITWNGDCCHGVLYAALDISLPGAITCFEKNVAYDGWVVEYITQADIEAWIDQTCVERKVTRDQLSDKNWLYYYWDHNRTYKTTLGEAWDRLTARVDPSTNAPSVSE